MKYSTFRVHELKITDFHNFARLMLEIFKFPDTSTITLGYSLYDPKTMELSPSSFEVWNKYKSVSNSQTNLPDIRFEVLRLGDFVYGYEFLVNTSFVPEGFDARSLEREILRYSS